MNTADCDTDQAFMKIALVEARAALEAREVPVGCVLVCARTGAELARGRNAMTARCNATAHAELNAAAEVLAAARSPAEGRARLRESALYVTVEPCVMCAAALLRLGVARVVFGCFNENFGGCGTVLGVHRGAAACLRRGAPPGTGAGASAGAGVGGAGKGGGERAVAAANGVFVSGGDATLEVVGGVCADEAVALLKEFYRRPNPKAKRTA